MSEPHGLCTLLSRGLIAFTIELETATCCWRSAAPSEPTARIRGSSRHSRYPPGELTVGREAIRALWERVLADPPPIEPETPLPTLVGGDLALTATRARDGAGGRAQVARRQPDGRWLRVLDQPELVPRDA
ncbi:MAG TPA: hypothetical protein VHX88_02250 [Solirubrobacteraceae bacterium]|nr:hypothetical protein [Solirubrobacteraceae bacterium]